MARKKRKQLRKPKRSKPSSFKKSKNISENILQLFGSALQYHQSGNLKEAESRYRDIIQMDPNNFNALHMIGVLACQKGDLDEGCALLEKAININSQDASCFNNLGKALHDFGKPKEAIECFRKAIEFNSNFYLAYCNLANSLNSIGKSEEAVDYCNKAIALNPTPSEAYNNIGNAYHNLKKFDKAFASYQKAIILQPNFAKAHYNLGMIYERNANLEEALRCYEKTIELNPEFAPAYNNLGIVHKDMGNSDDAIACYHKAIELNPNFAEAHVNLGNLSNNLGNIEYALECYNKATAIKPDFVEALANLASLFEQTNRLVEAQETVSRALQNESQNVLANYVAARCDRRQGRFEEALNRLRQLELPPVTSKAYIDIIFEQGILYDRLGQFDSAFQCISEGNHRESQKWKAEQIDKNHYIQSISKIHSYLLNDVGSSIEFTSKPFDESSPVFLIGFPRSGTTLLDQILNTSSVIETLEEKPLVQKMLVRFQAHGFSYPDDLNLLNSELLEDLKNAYFQEVSLYLNNRPETIMVDKLPLNTIDIGLIHRVFPESKIIFALRHPADTCLSCFFQNFSLNEAMIHFLDLTDTAKFYGMVMDLWHNYRKILSLDYHVVRYEDLVSDFEGETKRLFQFLNVPWERSVHDYNSHAKVKRKITTPSYHQVVEPLYKRSMYRWRNYAMHLRPIFEILEPHIRKFGYSLNEDMGKRQNIASTFNAQCPV